MRATVSSKGQVTIPKRLRDRLSIHEGSVLDFVEASGRMVVERVATDDPVAEVYGLLAAPGRRTDDLMRDLRGDGRP